MNTKPIYISRPDHLRLKNLTDGLLSSGVKRPSVISLQSELRRATVVDVSSLSTDVVALDSRVSVQDLDSGDHETYTITLPEGAHRGNDHISVLAPIGVALLGFSAGDEVAWETPGGMRRLRIESVVQNAHKTETIPPYFPDYLLANRSPA